MDKQTFEKDIKQMLTALLKMAEDLCYNKFSYNLKFILTDCDEFKFSSLETRNKTNYKKTLLNVNEAISLLYKEHSDLYDINLYVFKAKKYETIIEIEYYRKSSHDHDYYETIKNNPSMLHAKVSLPMYAKNGEKFDVNWMLGGFNN